MIAWLVALVVLSAGLTWALRREHARLEREAAYRRWLETSPKFAALTAAFTAFKVEIGVALLPAMQQMVNAAADAEKTMRQLNEVINRTHEETK